MARRSAKWNKWVAVLAEAIGLAISVYLLLISLKILYPGEVPCPRGSLFHCSSVLRGEWSRVGAVPTAALGVFYFLVQLAMSWKLPKRRTMAHWGKLVLTTIGVVYVAWLRAVEIVWLRGICPWCWGVAICVWAEAVVVYPLGIPPLPKLKLGGRVGVVAAATLILVVFSVAVARVMLVEQARSLQRELARDQRATIQPTSPPKPTQIPKAGTPKRTPAKSSEVPRQPTPRRGFVEEGVLPTQEVKLLAKHGWTVVASTQSMETQLEGKEPALLLIFDPQCEECQAFIRSGLETDEFAKRPIKLVAIEQLSLEGPLSKEVKNVPTLLLFDRDRQVRFKHEGRMSTGALLKQVEKVLPE